VTIPVAVGKKVTVLVGVGGTGVRVLVSVGRGVEVSVGLEVAVGISASDPCMGVAKKVHARIIPTTNRLSETIG
jgi:hypothetical protein